jgi:hypothetical protein
MFAVLWELMLNRPEDQTNIFEDEVDLNWNPQIGPMWLRKGQQAQVAIPNTHAKWCLEGFLA